MTYRSSYLRRSIPRLRRIVSERAANPARYCDGTYELLSWEGRRRNRLGDDHMNDVVSVSPAGPTMAQLGPYWVGIELTDDPSAVRINGERVRPPLNALVHEWAKLPGYPIETRRGPVHSIEFRLIEPNLHPVERH